MRPQKRVQVTVLTPNNLNSVYKPHRRRRAALHGIDPSLYNTTMSSKGPVTTRLVRRVHIVLASLGLFYGLAVVLVMTPLIQKSFRNLNFLI
jgi:hypothetical protein